MTIRLSQVITKRRALSASLIALSLVVAFLSGLFLRPYASKSDKGDAYLAMSPSYRAGGTRCAVSRIITLAGEIRQREINRCADAEEQLREATNTFLVNKRAANAAELSAIYSGQQAETAKVGVAAGVLTLIAAAAAALFAKLAANYTRDGANASARAALVAEDNLKVSREELKQAQSGLRAWITHKPKVTFNVNGRDLFFLVSSDIINTGPTPAVHSRTIIYEIANEDSPTPTNIHAPIITIGPANTGTSTTYIALDSYELYSSDEFNRKIKMYRV